MRLDHAQQTTGPTGLKFAPRAAQVIVVVKTSPSVYIVRTTTTRRGVREKQRPPTGCTLIKERAPTQRLFPCIVIEFCCAFQGNLNVLESGKER